jgi:plasmid stabilization system protein ParE
MPKLPKKYDVRLAGPARQDFSDLMEWTVQEFGERAAFRYETLIKQALKDIGADPTCGFAALRSSAAKIVFSGKPASSAHLATRIGSKVPKSLRSTGCAAGLTFRVSFPDRSR